MHEPGQLYQQRIIHLQSELNQLRHKRKWAVTFRILAFLGFAWLLYAWLKQDQPVAAWALLLFILFLVIIRYDQGLLKKIQFCRKKMAVNENELAIIRGEENLFSDGNSFPQEQPFITDLDITGKFSVYHLLNRCSTISGQAFLARCLQYPFKEAGKIREYQEASAVVAGQVLLREQVIANGLLIHEKDGSIDDVSGWMQKRAILLHQTAWQWLRYLLPVINIAGCIYWIVAGNYLPFVISVVISWIFIGRYSRYVQEQHLQLSKKQHILHQYAAILRCFSKIETSHSSLLQENSRTAAEAAAGIRKLSSLTELFDQRLNILAFLLLNSFFLYDLQIILNLEKWKNNNSKQFDHWMATIANIEYIISLAAFRYNNPAYCVPQIQESISPFTASQLSHPLIPEKERVYNECQIGKEEKLVLVTGSNMSGKSTFLRSIGVNLVLAQCGAVVCAEHFSCSPMQLLTCMRVNDNLEEHTSYFMAELKRLQQIIHALQSGQYAMVLIDEILRGTNSDDKHYGSEKYIGQLIRYTSLSFFATHDLALGDLETTHPGLISNYCFESEIKNDELYFDYKLRKGIAKNKNASFLMKKMEIIG